MEQYAACELGLHNECLATQTEDEIEEEELGDCACSCHYGAIQLAA